MSEQTPNEKSKDDYLKLSESASDQFVSFQYETNQATDGSGTATREDDFDA